MQEYLVISDVAFDGRLYAAGAAIELDAETAAPLLEVGAIRLPGDDPDLDAAPAVPPILEQAIAALRDASGDEVREFFRRLSDEEEIGAKLEDQMDRHATLIAAIADFGPDDAELWTRSGKPKTDALEAASGLTEISASERDAAWEEYRKAEDAAE